KSVYGLNASKGLLVVASADLSQRQTIALPGLSALSTVTVSPDKASVYVTQPGANAVSVFARDTNTGGLTLGQTLPTAAAYTSLAINGAGDRVLLGGAGGVQSFTRASDGTLTAASAVLQPAGLGAVSDLAFSVDGKFAYATGRTNGVLVVLAAADLYAASPA